MPKIAPLNITKKFIKITDPTKDLTIIIKILYSKFGEINSWSGIVVRWGEKTKLKNW